jgi:hypothetical protein
VPETEEMDLNLFQEIVSVCAGCSSILTLFLLLAKPVREKIFGLEKIKEGQKCILRQQMLHIYYNNREKKIIRQYEYENFMKSYAAYKALGGNSFVDKIYDEVRTWEVVT